MWNTSCSNKICFTQDKTYEQNLHLKRLFCIRPEINTTEPYKPDFLKIKAPQKAKRKQTQDQIDKDNYILEKKLLEVFIKNGKYSRYEVEPKEIYPAFRRYSRLKFSDIINLIKIHFENQKLENKLINIKSTYDNGNLRKEAEKQQKYLNNILNRPKSISFTPALNFISIEQLHKRLKNQLFIQQRYLNGQQNNNDNLKRRHSSSYLPNNTNNSKMNKSNGQINKSGNKSNRSHRSQSSKNRKSLKINNDIDAGNDEKSNKKNKKEGGTTKADTNTGKK